MGVGSARLWASSTVAIFRKASLREWDFSFLSPVPYLIRTPSGDTFNCLLLQDRGCGVVSVMENVIQVDVSAMMGVKEAIISIIIQLRPPGIAELQFKESFFLFFDHLVGQ